MPFKKLTYRYNLRKYALGTDTGQGTTLVPP